MSSSSIRWIRRAQWLQLPQECRRCYCSPTTDITSTVPTHRIGNREEIRHRFLVPKCDTGEVIRKISYFFSFPFLETEFSIIHIICVMNFAVIRFGLIWQLEYSSSYIILFRRRRSILRVAWSARGTSVLTEPLTKTNGEPRRKASAPVTER